MNKDVFLKIYVSVLEWINQRSIFLYCILLGLLFWQLKYIGIFLSLLFVAFLIWVGKEYKKANHVLKLKQYAVQVENIYEFSLHENDKEVYKRAEEHRKYLKLSKNKLDVEVQEIYFRDGEHINETWEEFQQRKDFFIRNDRSIRHSKLKKANNEWYIKNHHQQHLA